MALFKSAEEKALQAEAKEQQLMNKFGVGNLTDPEDRASVKKIAEELVGTGLMETGLKIGMAKAEIQLPISYQRAIMEQNFIIIRQLDKITQLLKDK
jgi:hypothetical protein